LSPQPGLPLRNRLQGPEGTEEGKEQSTEPRLLASRLQFVQECGRWDPREDSAEGKRNSGKLSGR